MMKQRGCRGDTCNLTEDDFTEKFIDKEILIDTDIILSRFYLAVLSSLLLSATNQVVGTERRLQPARLRKNIRNLTGLESSDMMT